MWPYCMSNMPTESSAKTMSLRPDTYWGGTVLLARQHCLAPAHRNRRGARGVPPGAKPGIPAGAGVLLQLRSMYRGAGSLSEAGTK